MATIRGGRKVDAGQAAIGIGAIVVAGIGIYGAYVIYKGVKDASNWIGGAGDYINKGLNSLWQGMSWVGGQVGQAPKAAWDAIKSVNPWAYKAPTPPPPAPVVTYFVPTEDFIAQFISGGKVVAQQSFKTQVLAQQYIDLNKDRYKNGDTWQILNAKTGARIVGGVISKAGIPSEPGQGEVIPGVSKKYMAQIIHNKKVVAIQQSDDLDSAHKFINANIGNKAWKPGTWQILDTNTGGRVDSGTFKGLDTPLGRYALGQYNYTLGMIAFIESNPSNLGNPKFCEALDYFNRAAAYDMNAIERLERF